MPARSRARTSTRMLAGGAIAALAVGMGGGAASGSGADRPAPRTVITGLDNPRGLSFAPNGDLYVAESGRGGTGPCVEGPESTACFGRSGAITRIRGGVASRVVTTLPSMASETGGGAAGPSDVVIKADGSYLVTVGLGNDPAVRDRLPAAGRLLAGVVSGRIGGTRTLMTDLGAYEASANVDGYGVDTNPTSITMLRSSPIVVDAGGNSLLKLTSNRVGKMAVFFNRFVPRPPFMPPGKMPMQSVPTAVTAGPDGALYVAELTGFPFTKGEARIYRVVPGKAPTVYARGLSNVTDLAFVGRQLYAVQLASDGLLNVPPNTLPMGSLVKITPGTRTHAVIAGDLPAPYGLAVRSGNAYVTTCAVCAGGGGVMEIPLG